MDNIRRPMLAASLTNERVDQLKYPVMVSPKLDGIRTLIHPKHGPVTRQLKPVPNLHVRDALSKVSLHGFDGELVLRDGTFNETQSAVMSHDGTPNVEFWVFDDFSDTLEAFHERLEKIEHRLRRLRSTEIHICAVPHYWARTPEEARKLIATQCAEGFEGAMIRVHDGRYKEGRSTLNEALLLKHKNFADAEGIVVGVEELMHNDNLLTTSELGYAKRSSAKDGMVGTGTLGALVLETDWGELKVGTGFDRAAREKLWKSRKSLVGERVTFKYQGAGMQEKPRFPVFMHFRDPRD